MLRATAVVAVALLVLMGIARGCGSTWTSRAEPEAAAQPAGVPGRLIDVGAHPVHVVERGSGSPLLLVHGFAGSTFDWEEHVLVPLARDHRVIAVDLYGMGFSARDPDMPYGLDLWADQLRGLLDVLEVPRAAVAGHSLGGAVATAFAVAYPERVERLALIAPLVPMDESERALFFRLLAVPGLGEAVLAWRDHLPALPGFSEAYRERARAAFRIRGTRGALLGWVRRGYDPAALDAVYRQVAAPTLIVAGRSDDIVPWRAIEHAATEIPGAVVLPLDGQGHWLLRDAPDRVVAALRAFQGGEEWQ